MQSSLFIYLDYVFVETQPSHPYQIRRIEELTKVSAIFYINTVKKARFPDKISVHLKGRGGVSSL